MAAHVTLLSRNLHLQEVVKSRYTSLTGSLILHELVTLLESRILVTFQDQLKFMCYLLGGVFLAHHPLITSGTAVSHVCGGGNVLYNQSIRPNVYHTVWFSSLGVVVNYHKFGKIWNEHIGCTGSTNITNKWYSVLGCFWDHFWQLSITRRGCYWHLHQEFTSS